MNKTKAQLQAENDLLKEKLATLDLVNLMQPAPNNTIQNCHFETKIWDEKAIGTIQTVADALLNLTELFVSQKIKLAPSLVIKGSKVKSAQLKKVDETD